MFQGAMQTGGLESSKTLDHGVYFFLQTEIIENNMKKHLGMGIA